MSLGECYQKEKTAIESLSLKKHDIKFTHEELGRGSFAVVKKGVLFGTDWLALKKLRAARVKRMALKEIEFHARLRHPNIVQLMGICLEEGGLWLVSELISGGIMESLIYDRSSKWPAVGQITDVIKLAISVQCAQGLAYLHSTEPPVVHMDLKPQNILITYNMDAKICDFGLAKSKSQIVAATSLHPSQHVGTPYYMAPEILLSPTPSRNNTPCDIWSMGAILLELFVERDIWFPNDDSDSSDFDAVNSIKEMMKCETPPPTSFLVKCVGMREVLNKCLAYDATARPNAVKFLEFLKKMNIG